MRCDWKNSLSITFKLTDRSRSCISRSGRVWVHLLKKKKNHAKSSTNNSKVCLSVTKQQQALSIQDSCSGLDGPSAACTMGLLARLPMVPPVSSHRVTSPQAPRSSLQREKSCPRPRLTSDLWKLRPGGCWLQVCCAFACGRVLFAARWLHGCHVKTSHYWTVNRPLSLFSKQKNFPSKFRKSPNVRTICCCESI